MDPNMTDYKLFVLIYSALVATIALTWNIINAVLKNRGKIEVQCVNMMLFRTGLLKANHLPPILNITVTNRGYDVRHIQQPVLETSIRIQGTKLFSLIDFGGKFEFPVKLKRGEEFKMPLDIRELDESIFKYTQRNHILWRIAYYIYPPARPYFRIIVEDTIEKRYVSQKMLTKSCENVLKAYEMVSKNKNSNV